MQGSWPSFDVADMALVFGVVLLTINLWHGERKSDGRSFPEHDAIAPQR